MFVLASEEMIKPELIEILVKVSWYIIFLIKQQPHKVGRIKFRQYQV